MSHQRVSGFPERGVDLWGGPGTSGEVQGTCGEVWGTSGWLLKIHCEISSGEAGNAGKSRDVPESPATCQHRLQLILTFPPGILQNPTSSILL